LPILNELFFISYLKWEILSKSKVEKLIAYYYYEGGYSVWYYIVLVYIIQYISVRGNTYIGI